MTMKQEITLYQDKTYLGTYSHSAAANVAGRVQAKATGAAVCARVYDVTDTTKVLVKRYSIIPRLDGSVVFA